MRTEIISQTNCPIVDKSLNVYLQTKRNRESLKWGTFNIILLSIVLFDLSNKCPYAISKWYYVEYTAAFILALSVLYYFGRYFYYLFLFEPVVGTVEQRKLLKFDEKDNSFITTTSVTKKPIISTTPINISGLSWNSSFNDSNATTAASWAFMRGGSSQHPSFNQSFGQNMSNVSLTASANTSGMFVSPYKNLTANDDYITDEKGLQQYLKKTAQEDFATITSNETSNTIGSNSMGSFWNNYKLDDLTGLLKTSLYQLSPTTVSPKQSGKDESGLFSGTDLDGSFENGKKISSAKLSHYVTNLKRWFSCTILERLVQEINSIDSAFKSKGLSDIQIGNVGLERLRKTAENQLVILNIPMLPLVIPFLELTTNQEYLVSRIKDLAKGSCLADYHWNSGATNWDEHLPTDAAIIFHLFCTYLDSQLMPLPQPGGRPFYNRYVVMGDKKSQKETLAEVKNKSKCAILCTNPMKPSFNFISDDKIHNSVQDRNNLFHVIAQFLIYMKTHHEGRLEGVNLGKSGINILCVVED